MSEYTRVAVRFQEQELKIPYYLDEGKDKINGRLMGVKAALENKEIDIVDLDFSESQDAVSRETMDKIVRLILDECGIYNSSRIYVGLRDREVYLDSLMDYFASHFCKFDAKTSESKVYRG